MMNVRYQIESYRSINVCWLPELDGGGRSFGQDYLPVVHHLFGRIGRVFEFCGGPAFIGFSLLAHGLCDSLAVADVNPRAVDALKETVRRNGLGDRVAVYQSDGLDVIPDHEMWDLVVGNPPHFATPFHVTRPNLITDDLHWQLHKSFYRDVGCFLAAGGSVLLQESSKGSAPDDFQPMLRDGGLDHIRTLWYPANGQSCFYYLWVKKSLDGLILDDTEPRTYEVALTEPASALAIDSSDVVRLRLRNQLDRLVRPRLITDAWDDLLEPMRPRTVRELPLQALGPGRYVVADMAASNPGGELAVITVVTPR